MKVQGGGSRYYRVPKPVRMALSAAIGALAGWKISGWRAYSLRARQVATLASGIAGAGGVHLAERLPIFRSTTPTNQQVKRGKRDLIEEGRSVDKLFKTLSQATVSSGELLYLDLRGVPSEMKHEVPRLVAAAKWVNTLCLDETALDCLQGGRAVEQCDPIDLILDAGRRGPEKVMDQAMEVFAWSRMHWVTVLVDDVGGFVNGLKQSKEARRNWTDRLRKLGCYRQADYPLTIRFCQRSKSGDRCLGRIPVALPPLATKKPNLKIEIWNRSTSVQLDWYQQLDALLAWAETEERSLPPTLQPVIGEILELDTDDANEIMQELLAWGLSDDPLVNEQKYAALLSLLWDVNQVTEFPEGSTGIFRDSSQLERFRSLFTC